MTIYNYHRFSNNLITESQYEEFKTIQGNESLHKTTVINDVKKLEADTKATTQGTDSRVYGYFEWMDDNNDDHPLQGFLVELYEKTSDGRVLIGSIYTNDIGYYSFSFENTSGKNVYLRLSPKGQYVQVMRNLFVNYSSNTDEEYVAPGGSRFGSYYYDMSTETGRAYQIAQALIYGAKYYFAMSGNAPTFKTAHYPCSNTQYFLSYIQIVNNDYRSWDVILHEYGHYVQTELKITNSPGGEHGFWQNLADRYSDKSKGICLAWGEAWPTVFANLVTKKFASSLDANIDGINDDEYDDYVYSIHWNIPNTIYTQGEACEGSIANVLYLLYDRIGHQNFWNRMAESKAKTFSEFANYIYNYYSAGHSTVLLFNELCERVKIYGYNLRATTGTATISPTWTWDSGGGSTTYGNNQSCIYVFDQSGSQIYNTGLSSTNIVTLSDYQWQNTILASYGQTYYVEIRSNSTSSPQTGTYRSGRIAYTKPVVAPLRQDVNISRISRYFENIASLLPGQYIDYYVTFVAAGNQVFQTFGSKDAYLYLYDASGSLIAQNDDAGDSLNALISYSIQANTTYKVRVKFYSSSQFGDIKLAIMPSRLSYSNYEEIDYTGFAGSHSGSGGSRWLTLNRVNLYTVSTDALYTFNIYTSIQEGDPQVDTYLYLIDPTSTAPCIFNDDGGGDLQAKITAQLEPNKRFFNHTIGLQYYRTRWKSLYDGSSITTLCQFSHKRAALLTVSSNR